MTLGGRVKHWVTFNEANDWVSLGLGYSTNQNPLRRCTTNIVGQMNMNYGDCPYGDSGTEPYIVGHNLLLAHAEAVSIYRDKYQVSSLQKEGSKNPFQSSSILRSMELTHHYRMNDYKLLHTHTF